MKFKAKLKSIKLFGYHGVLPEEQEKGQDFLIDLTFGFIKQNPEDKIEATIDYAQVYRVAEETFKATRYNLLENLAQDIANAVLDSFSPIIKVKVAVSKINPPIKGSNIEKVTVTYKSKRK